MRDEDVRNPFQGLFDYVRSGYSYSSGSGVGGGRSSRNTISSSLNSRRVISNAISFPQSSSSLTNHLMPNPNLRSSLEFPAEEQPMVISHHDDDHLFHGNETVISEQELQCHFDFPSHNLHLQHFQAESSHPVLEDGGRDNEGHSLGSSTNLISHSSNQILTNEIPPYDISLEKQFQDQFRIQNHSSSFCLRNWDGALCWPDTPEGQTASLPCFAEFHGIPYDTSQNATRYCEEGGIWENRTDYSSCIPLPPKVVPIGPNEDNLEITTRVYFYGYCLSLCALTIAMVIFLVFKELRCLRNTIHTHLIVTYILSDMLWIITSSTTLIGASSDPQNHHGRSNQVSCVAFILLHYFHLTNFFWMFVEGLYLYVLVVLTFVADNIKLRIYACIGWGLPFMVVVGWSIAKFATKKASEDIQETDPEFNVSTCMWLTVNHYDWIYKAPAILVLAANILFLLQIMWVLITKLRSATNPETQQSRKAAKALVVLMPLLGITYVLVLTGSRTAVYEYLRALLISTQGFLVALLYCFLNGEVRIALRHRWNRIRTLGPEMSCCERREQVQHTRDWRSRTESLRLYETSRSPSYRKRDSCVSETTMSTPLHAINNGSAGNGSGLMGHRLSTTYVPSTQKYFTSVTAKVENESVARV